MHRNDVFRIVRRVFDLLPQLGDVHVHRARQWEAAVAPDRFQQLIPRNHLAAMFDEALGATT